MSVPVYQDSIASELVYVLDHAEISIIVAEDQEQVDKVLSLRGQLPNLRWSSTRIRAACALSDDPILHSFARWWRQAAVRPGATRIFRARARQGRRQRHGDDRLHLGHHGRAQGRDAEPPQHDERRPRASSKRTMSARRQWLCYLPMAWVGDRVLARLALLVGAHLQLPGEPRDRAARPARARPDDAIAPPRIWENMLTLLQVRAATPRR